MQEYTQLTNLEIRLRARRASGRDIINLIDSSFHDQGFFPDQAGLAAAAANYFTRKPYRPDAAGSSAAREAIVRYYRNHGYAPDPLRILLTASSSEAYSLLFSQLAHAGDHVLLPLPSYPLFEDLASYAGLEMGFYPLAADNGFQPDLDMIESLIRPGTRFLLLVSPGNPTGAVLSYENMDRILRICRTEGIMLIVDEVFAPYCLEPAPKALGREQGVPVFTINGISKLAASPDLKLSWLILSGGGAPGFPEPGSIYELLESASDSYLNCSALSQHLLPLLLEEAQMPAGVTARVRALLERNRAVLVQTMPPRFLPSPPQGGIHCMIRLPGPGPHSCHRGAGLSDEDLAIRLLEEEGIYLHPGSLYGMEDERYFVISLLKLPEHFDRALAALSGFLERCADTGK